MWLRDHRFSTVSSLLFCEQVKQETLRHNQLAIIFYFLFSEEAEQESPACSFSTFLERFVTSRESMTSRESLTDVKIMVTKCS